MMESAPAEFLISQFRKKKRKNKKKPFSLIRKQFCVVDSSISAQGNCKTPLPRCAFNLWIRWITFRILSKCGYLLDRFSHKSSCFFGIECSRTFTRFCYKHALNKTDLIIRMAITRMNILGYSHQVTTHLKYQQFNLVALGMLQSIPCIHWQKPLKIHVIN